MTTLMELHTQGTNALWEARATLHVFYILIIMGCICDIELLAICRACGKDCTIVWCKGVHLGVQTTLLIDSNGAVSEWKLIVHAS